MSADQAHILLVDDDPSIQRLLASLLRRHGCLTDCASDGEEALKKLRSERYSAILLDLLMPRLNGFEVLQDISALRPELLPDIIVLTAASDQTLTGFPDAPRICGVLRKPLDKAELLERVDVCLARNKTRRIPQPPTSAERGQPTRAHATGGGNHREKADSEPG